MRRCSSLTCVCLLGAAFACAGTPAAAVDKSRLWLPRANASLQPDLLEAAKFAEQSPECVEVISGELDVRQSTDSAPVFRIVCQNKAGFTYGVRVRNAGAPNAEMEKVQTAASLAESSALQEDGESDGSEAAANTGSSANEDVALRHCEESLKRRTSGMTGVEIDMSRGRRSTTADGMTQYEIDFEAKDPTGEPLLFSAVCRVTTNAAVSVQLHPRPKAGKAPSLPASAPVESQSSQSTAAAKDTGSATKPAESVPVSNVQKATDDGWDVVE